MPTHSWTDAISNQVVCGYFYLFFVVFSVWAGLSLLGGIYIFASTKMAAGQLISILFNIILSGGIAATQALFLYLICDRALNPSSVRDPFQAEQDPQQYSM
jgi:hypothetical protein